MTHDEIVSLIRAGVTGNTWADFGAGAGNFTRALLDLLGEEVTCYAVDRDGAALRTLSQRLPTVKTIQADFTQPIDLPPLDGLLIANALHFVRRQDAVINQLLGYLKEDGRLLIVEYDVKIPRGYIPFPLPYRKIKKLYNAKQIGYRTSPRTGISMYCGQIIRPKL